MSKHQDALPLYRQETILKRIGVELPRATLANWMIQAGNPIQKLYRIEKQARKLKPEERHRHRQQHARPILNELRA